MRERFYTLLFAILPSHYQHKLWGHLANKYGYHGLTKFGNGTMWLCGTPLRKNDALQKLYRGHEEQKEKERKV